MNFLDRLSSKHLVVILIILVVAAYFMVFRNGFVGDDNGLIVQNQNLSRWDDLGDLFKGRTPFDLEGKAFEKHIYYKPVLGIWWKLNYSIAGTANPAFFHTLQLGLHIINVALVYCLVLSVTSLTKEKSQVSAQIQAFFIALIWGLHPANSESVVYVAAGQEPLFLFFGLIAMNLITWRDNLINFLRQKNSWSEVKSFRVLIVLTGLTSLLSVLTKETGILIGIFSLSYVFLIGNKKYFKQYLGLFAVVWSFYFYLRFGVAQISLTHHAAHIPIQAATFGQRVLTIPYIYVEYLRLFVLPLELFTGSHLVVKSIDLLWVFKLSVIILVTAVFIWLSRKSKLRQWLLMCLFFSFGIISNILALDMTYSERWLYLPFLFLIWYLVSLIPKLTQNIRWLFLLLGCLFILRIWMRVPDWQNSYSVSLKDQQYQVDGYHTKVSLAEEFLKQGEYARATDLLNQAIAINPAYSQSYYVLGKVNEQSGDLAEAEKNYVKAIETNNSSQAWEKLSLLYYTHQIENWEEVLNKGLAEYPNNSVLLELKSRANKESTQEINTN